jgi:DNA-directed RNA polymerase subunit RPC12/RpoP
MAGKTCVHPFYKVVEGRLVCSECGAPSPRASLDGDQIVRIGDKEIRCPKCGTLCQEARTTETIETKPIKKK